MVDDFEQQASQQQLQLVSQFQRPSVPSRRRYPLLDMRRLVALILFFCGVARSRRRDVSGDNVESTVVPVRQSQSSRSRSGTKENRRGVRSPKIARARRCLTPGGARLGNLPAASFGFETAHISGPGLLSVQRARTSHLAARGNNREDACSGELERIMDAKRQS